MPRKWKGVHFTKKQKGIPGGRKGRKKNTYRAKVERKRAANAASEKA